jgi:thiosulfate/3-mercaptopyruvate sulfurtransferase
MMTPLLPLIVDGERLQSTLGDERVLVVDLCKADTYAQAHIPGAAHLDYAQVVAARPPTMGLLPDDAALSALFSSLGLTPDTHVVAYDDEGGGRAARLLWTLEVIGHTRYSLLNGGLHAWSAERRPLTRDVAARPRTNYRVTDRITGWADAAYVRDHLDDPAVVLVDTRSPQEYRGEKKLAERAGHIPGAVNFDWVNAMDLHHQLRLKPAAELRHALEALGITPDKEAIVYCQTHHRSAHTFIVLKSLGYTRIKGYPGSWSEWGNRSDLPIA